MCNLFLYVLKLYLMSPLSNDHRYFDHPYRCTLSLPTISIVFSSLLLSSTSLELASLLFSVALATALLKAGLMFSDSFLLLSMYLIHLTSMAKGASLYLKQIKFSNNPTTFIGWRNACKDFVDVSFLSFNFPCPCLCSPFLCLPTARFQVCSGSEFMQLLVLDLTYAKPNFYVL